MGGGISCGSILQIPEWRGSYENPFHGKYEYFVELHIEAVGLPRGGGGGGLYLDPAFWGLA